MAQLDTSSGDSGKKGGKVKAKKQSTTVDMTPMVDLAFLLLTFFILTATFNKPQALDINMPVPVTDPLDGTNVPQDLTTTLLVDKGSRLFYYDGVFDPANPAQIQKTDLSKDGIRKLLIDKNQIVYNKVNELKDQLRKREIVDTVYTQRVQELKKNFKVNRGRIVIIKPTDNAMYADVVSLLDEMAITNVASFALVDITPEEIAAIENL